MTQFRPYTFCSFCGARYPEDLGWPRVCPTCGNTTYRNPLPVAVVLVPVERGILLVRRSIPPRLGELALPGGFINIGESWQQAGAREVAEETGLVLDPAGIRLHDTLSAPDGTVLIFGTAPHLALADLPPFVPNNEASEIAFTETSIVLAFPLHTQALASYFQRSSNITK